MGALGDFASGVTELPRELIGGAAVALGANPDSVDQTLGLDKHPLSMMENIQQHPAKFIGELIPYVLLPSSIFGRTAAKALAKKALRTGLRKDRLKSAAHNIATTSATFGVYGGTEEAAKSQLENRDSHIAASAITDGLFTIGLLSLAKGAFVAASKIKNKAMQHKSVKDVFLDAGFPPDASSGIAKMSDADRRAFLLSLDGNIENAKNAIAAASQNIAPSIKYNPPTKEKTWVDDMFGLLSKDAHKDIEQSVDKTGLRSQEARPVIEAATGKGKVAPESARPIGLIRMAGDDLNTHLGIIGRHSNNIMAKIVEAVPEKGRRLAIRDALDVNGASIYRGLSPDEKIIADKVRELFDSVGRHLVNEKVINGFLPEYIPYIINGIGAKGKGFFDSILESAARRSHISTSTNRAKKRNSNVPLRQMSNDPGYDIAELLNMYMLDTTRAIAMKNVFKKIGVSRDAVSNKISNTPLEARRNVILKKNYTPIDVFDTSNGMISETPKEGFIKVDVNTHPSLITNYIKTQDKVKNFVHELHLEFDSTPLSPKLSKKEISKKRQEYIDRELPPFFEDLRQRTELYIHPDFKPSLDLLLKATDIPKVMQAVVATNFVMKRMLVMMSMFHFNALSESALFSKAGGIGAMAKGAGAGFLITGGNPIGAAVGAGLGAGAHVLIRTKNIAAQMRGGKYGDVYDFAQRYIDLRPPRDVGTDEFYNGLSGLQGIIDKYVPSNMAKGALKSGTKAIGGINKVIDVLMWHRLMSGAKITVFHRELERLTEKNMLLPEIEQRSQHELATVAGQFVNDAFGGQNWRKLAEGVESQMGRRWAAAASSEAGIRWANLLAFAPDWTISNIRILAKAFPGINKDKLSREMYQRYAMRSAMYYAIVGSAIQYMLTGNSILSNDDPTRIDLGDGRTMTFSKQLAEPFKWIESPVHEAIVKQSSILKTTEAILTNQKYIGAYGKAPAIYSDDETPIEKVGKSLQIAGKSFAPIFVQDINRNGMDGVYGFFGHPIYGHIRHGFKKADGKIEQEKYNDSVNT